MCKYCCVLLLILCFFSFSCLCLCFCLCFHLCLCIWLCWFICLFFCMSIDGNLFIKLVWSLKDNPKCFGLHRILDLWLYPFFVIWLLWCGEKTITKHPYHEILNLLIESWIFWLINFKLHDNLSLQFNDKKIIGMAYHPLASHILFLNKFLVSKMRFSWFWLLTSTWSLVMWIFSSKPPVFLNSL